MSLYAAAGTDSNAVAVSAAVCTANEDKIYNHLSCKKGRIMIEFLDNYSIRGAI